MKLVFALLQQGLFSSAMSCFGGEICEKKKWQAHVRANKTRAVFCTSFRFVFAMKNENDIITSKSFLYTLLRSRV
jgi:hypothetical protein